MNVLTPVREPRRGHVCHICGGQGCYPACKNSHDIVTCVVCDGTGWVEDRPSEGLPRPRGTERS